MRTKVVIPVLLALSLTFTGCADEGPDQAASQWATSMCEELGSFTAAIGSITTALQGLAAQTGQSVKEKKAEFVSLVEQGEQAVAELISGLRALGTPDVEGGDQAVTTFVGQMEEMKSVFEEFGDRFEEIDVSKPKEAVADLQAAATEMQDRFLELQSESAGMSGISPEIDEAIGASERCQTVLGEPSPAP